MSHLFPLQEDYIDPIGILFFTKNHRPGGNDHIVGSGIAVITVQESNDRYKAPTVSARRVSEYWWDGETEPYYGDVTALRVDNFIYAYGHAKDTPYIYVTRVHYQSVLNLDHYEYWNGRTWQSERLRNVGEKEGMFWQIQQGQMIWSEYYRCFLFIFTGMSRVDII